MNTSEILYFMLPLVLASTVPLALVALGALFSERSGVINIALEGIMLMGGFVGAVVMRYLEGKGLFSDSPQMIVLIGLGVAALAGMIFSLAHAFAAVNMKANQIISATALNMFAPAFAIFTARAFLGGAQQIVIAESYKIRTLGFLSDIPVIGKVFFTDAYLSTYLGAVLFIIAVIVLYKTKIGLRLRSCGENPHAADSLGINIYRIRYLGTVISGALAGMGGIIFVLSFGSSFNATVAGFGFLALAVLIFGNWKPGRIIFAALFFGSMRVIGSTYNIVPFLDKLEIDGEFYSMIPYIATLFVLAFVSKNSASPKAAGEPYDPGKR